MPKFEIIIKYSGEAHYIQDAPSPDIAKELAKQRYYDGDKGEVRILEDEIIQEIKVKIT